MNLRQLAELQAIIEALNTKYVQTGD